MAAGEDRNLQNRVVRVAPDGSLTELVRDRTAVLAVLVDAAGKQAAVPAAGKAQGSEVGNIDLTVVDLTTGATREQAAVTRAIRKGNERPELAAALAPQGDLLAVYDAGAGAAGSGAGESSATGGQGKAEAGVWLVNLTSGPGPAWPPAPGCGPGLVSRRALPVRGRGWRIRPHWPAGARQCR